MYKNVIEYININTLYKRDPENKNVIIPGDFSLPQFELLKDLKWEVTEKIDGTNTRIAYHVKSKNLYLLGKSTKESDIHKAQLGWFYDNRDNLQAAFEEVFPVTEKTKDDTFVVLYGEIFGNGVLKLGHTYGDIKFRIFDINIDGHWLNTINVTDVLYKLETCRSHGGVGPLFMLVPKLPSLTLMEAEAFILSKPFSEITRNAFMEGVVCKLDGLLTGKGERLVVKIKYHDYKRIGMCE